MDRLTYPRKFLLISVLFGIPLALATYFLFGEINDSLGVGIAQGYATIGAIGFEGRWDYGAIGTVANLAARLCGEAKGARSSSRAAWPAPRKRSSTPSPWARSR